MRVFKTLNPAEPKGTEPEAVGLDLLALSATVWRGKWLVAFFAILGLLVGRVYVAEFTTPRYTSTVEVMLEARDATNPEAGGVMASGWVDPSVMNSQVRVLRSRGLAGDVVDKLNLAADPDFNPYLRTPEPAGQRQLAARIVDWLPWTEPYLGGLAAETEVEPSREPSAEEARNTALAILLGTYTVSYLDRTYSFFISAETPDPEKSALLANAVADAYIRGQVERKLKATEYATDWLSSRAAELKDELEAMEQRVQQFATEAEVISPEALEVQNRQLADFRRRAQQTRAEIAENGEKLAAIEAAAQSADPAAIQSAARAALSGSAERSLSERQLRDVTVADLGPMAERLRRAVGVGRSQAEALEARVSELEARIDARSRDLVTLQQLQRETEATRMIYESFLARLKETSLRQGSQQPDSTLLSPGVVPSSPSSPNVSRVQALSLLLGALAGAGLVLLRNVRAGFRSAEELEQASSVPVLGQIPVFPVRVRSQILQHLGTHANSQMAEALRNLRTSLLYANIDHPPKLLLVTSTVPNEGKTIVSVTMAHTLAGLGKRVLLIEGDIRRRTLNKFLRARFEHGIQSVVRGDVALEDAVVRIPGLDADMLLGERSKLNAADFFASSGFGNLMARLGDIYDFVVIDTPPVLLVPDARLIAKYVDSVLYVVHWDATPRAQVLQGLREFALINVRVSGLVLNKINPRKMQRYGYKSYQMYRYSKNYYK